MIAAAPALRAAALLVPAAATAALLGWRRPAPRRRAAALLAGLWVLPSLLLVDGAARALGLWWYAEASPALLGMPVDLLLGWTFLWGPLATLALARLPLGTLLAMAAWLDLALMPALAPAVELAPGWLLGELAALLGVLLPAQILARLTDSGRALGARASLQALLFAAWCGFVVPVLLLSGTGSPLRAALARLLGHRALGLQLLVLPALLGLAAIQELAARGGGTPIPFDPPPRLVTSGLYAYLRNPMQLAQVLLLLAFAAVLAEPWFLAAALAAFSYGAGLARWDEERDLEQRFGPAFARYRSEVRNWIPRTRPFVTVPARLHVATSCGACSALGRWIAARRPVGLELHAAEELDRGGGGIRRLTYVAGDPDANPETGIAALARALEHLHLGWALGAAVLRLPLVRPLVQLAADASGAGPRRLPAACYDRPPVES